MKKHSKTTVSPKRGQSTQPKDIAAIGIDLGDRNSRYCMIGSRGEIVAEGSVATTSKAMGGMFAVVPRCRIALEVGTHSPWVSRLLAGLGHEVTVANARELKAITASSRKSDALDARMLARLAPRVPRTAK